MFKYYKEEEEIKELKEKDLIKARLKFKSFSILVKGSYNKKVFPGFPDKTLL